MVRTLFTVLGVSVALTFCKSAGNDSASNKKSESKDGSGQTDGKDSSGGSLEATMPVPIELLDPQVISSASTDLNAYQTDATISDVSSAVDAATTEDTPGPIAGAAAGQLTLVGKLMEMTFGKDGFFHGKAVKVPTKSPSVIYRVAKNPASGDPEFAVVSSTGAADFPFHVELFSQNAAHSYEGFATFDFLPLGTADVRIRITFFSPPLPNQTDARKVLLGTIDTQADTIDTKVGILGKTSQDGRTGSRLAAVHFAKTKDGGIDLQGASRVVEISNDPPDPFDPTYGLRFVSKQSRAGDLGLFRSRRNAAGDEAREIAFVTTDLAASYDAKLTTAFDDQPLSKFVEQYLTGVIRNNSSPRCSTSGTTIGNGLPANVCASNAQVTDAALLTALDNACQGGGTLPLVVQGRNGQGDLGPRQLDVCGLVNKEKNLANPEYFSASNGSKTQVFAEQASTALKDLETLLKKDGFAIEYATLMDTKYPSPDVKDAAFFKGAVDQPVQ